MALKSSQTMALPPEVVLSIQNILDLKQSDPLDTLGEFDPVETLNNHFPDETSLSQVNAIQARLRQDEEALQHEIAALVAELKKDHSPHRMQLIQEMISELLTQMNRIREKATESEAIVKNITKDIQSLDLAKKNIIQSMTALKRFQMLVNALAQLEELVKVKNYSEISQSLAAVKEISASFKSYRSIEQIAAVWRRIQEQQGALRNLLEEDFDKFLFQDPAKPIRLSTIADLCSVADVLGEDVQYHLIDKYCSTELREYRRIFRVADEAGQLDNISRRFAWFRRILKLHDEEHARAFPTKWKVGQKLCARFVEITREDLVVILSKVSKTLGVVLLLESLQHTLDFENQMAQKFGEPLPEILKNASYSGSTYRLASSAFEPHMSIYVDAQDKALADLLAPHRSAKSRPSLEGVLASEEDRPSVLPSSTELFYFYAQNLDQCYKLSKGNPLFELCALYKKWLRLYAEDVLIAGLKKPDTVRKSLESKINKAEILNACLLINTAEYCQVTSAELEEKIKENIDEEHKEQVTLQPEIDVFVSVISAGILVLLRELELACDSAFTSMLRISFGSIENVTGQSPYVDDLMEAINTVTSIVRENIQTKKYLRNFYDKTVNLIFSRFANALVKSRPLRESGAEQLLLDLQSLKACLLRIPGTQANESSTAAFAKTVSKVSTRLETLLKVVNAPADPIEGFITNYIVLIGDASYSNFQKILDLKGTPRSEQSTLTDTFLTTVSTGPELEHNSFLSDLDMEPTTTQLTAATTAALGRASLPNIFSGGTGIIPLDGGSPSLLGAFTPPQLSRAATPNSTRSDDGSATGQKKTGFGDLRRFVTFGVRRETAS